MTAPGLSDDCFALPPGVHWTPVDEALAHLKERMRVVVETQAIEAATAGGRILCAPVRAARAHPPYANSAIDGYGFAYASLGPGEAVLRLAEGRSAAGEPFEGTVRAGSAVRIMTGAMIPQGVDTVVMQEDVTLKDGSVCFGAGLRRGANYRAEGEDVPAGKVLFDTGRKLGAADLALLAATGVSQVQVYRPLRVALLSTGDEIRPAGSSVLPHQVYDANRPMLAELNRRWDFEPVDLGHAKDTKKDVAAALDAGAAKADVILASGGASAGDEDHVSATLENTGTLSTWRIAVKPGRPLALGLWRGVPVFGLPGNPVAAFVCTLIFARPALLAMSGAGWSEPPGIITPAAFSKNKKPGRREYLRARLNTEGAAEVYASEGSGRISGLSWARGLVELADGAADIAPGTMVRYLPFGEFGL